MRWKWPNTGLQPFAIYGCWNDEFGTRNNIMIQSAKVWRFPWWATSRRSLDGTNGSGLHEQAQEEH